ncbi:MAG TPA: hypothetical protein VK968_01250, partial [Roseimicrobium sp.]|nr:hypothetical protein [Roseimicrobium sp.]
AKTDSLFQSAWTTAQRADASVDAKASAARLIARDAARRVEVVTLLSGWLTPQTPGALQQSAIVALTRTGDARAAELILAKWAGFSPESRITVLETLTGREVWVMELLSRVKAGQISPGAFDAGRRSQLQRHPSGKVKQLAAEVFQSSGASSRTEVVNKFTPALALAVDAAKGRSTYIKLCVNCHKLDNQGNEVGPDLRSVIAHPSEKLLKNILDPSSDVQPGFFAYSCTLKNGDEFYGLITGEAGNGITMKLADGTLRQVLRGDIAELRGGALSLMPEGLEAGLTHQDVADLIQFLRTPR